MIFVITAALVSCDMSSVLGLRISRNVDIRDTGVTEEVKEIPISCNNIVRIITEICMK
jgi:hypothetical protein